MNFTEYPCDVLKDTLITRIPTGMPALDRILGGGFAKGEGSLVIGASGAGKSVCCTQFAYDMCCQDAGYKGLTISTEMPSNDYGLRLLSNKCGIPYTLIKDGFNDSAITNSLQRDRYERLREENKRLHICRWRNESSENAVAAIDDELKRVQDELGGLDFVHLDQLGRALRKNDLSNPFDFRQVWQEGADAVAELAAKHNISFTAYAQAHAQDAINKRCVTPEMAAECKSLHRAMAFSIGISAVRNECETAGGAVYEDIQYFFVGKSRRGPGGLVPFRRKFDQMRIEPVDACMQLY